MISDFSSSCATAATILEVTPMRISNISNCASTGLSKRPPFNRLGGDAVYRLSCAISPTSAERSSRVPRTISCFSTQSAFSVYCHCCSSRIVAVGKDRIARLHKIDASKPVCRRAVAVMAEGRHLSLRSYGHSDRLAGDGTNWFTSPAVCRGACRRQLYDCACGQTAWFSAQRCTDGSAGTSKRWGRAGRSRVSAATDASA